MDKPKPVLREERRITIREKAEGHKGYYLTVPLGFAKQHDLDRNRTVLVEYGEELRVIPIKGDDVAAA